MASRYVPPHLRRQSNAQADEQEPEVATHEEQPEDLEPRRLADLKLSDNDKSPLYTLTEIKLHFGSSTTNSTLHNSTEYPNELAYVVLFRSANPRWYSDNIIFAHTNIHLLDGYEAFKAGLDATADDSCAIYDSDSATSVPRVKFPNSEAPSPASPRNSDTPNATTNATTTQSKFLPVFMELGMARGVRRRYVFHGFFSITKIEFLKPYSPELVRMLEEKWKPVQPHPNRPPAPARQRDKTAWDKSMSQEWSVIKMSRPPKKTWPRNPSIERLPEEDQEEPGRAEGRKPSFGRRWGPDGEDPEIGM